MVSRTFSKAPRLRKFLEFICTSLFEGRADDINEQQIGIQVFGRSESYNAADDSIVRTQARLLRQRLEEYFEHECPESSLIISVPKGRICSSFRASTGAGNPEGPNAVLKGCRGASLAKPTFSIGLDGFRLHIFVDRRDHRLSCSKSDAVEDFSKRTVGAGFPLREDSFDHSLRRCPWSFFRSSLGNQWS